MSTSSKSIRMHSREMSKSYQKNGFFVLRNFFSEEELNPLRDVLQAFHKSWKAKHAEFYAERAVNSAYLTGTEHLTESQRLVLFGFTASSKLMNVVEDVFPREPAFMNTQLFFNPVNIEQKNYWHRDPQYHLSVEEQQEALVGPEVIHFRVPLFDEPGLELVPMTHRRWDTEEELAVRLEQNGHKNHEDLSTGVSIELAAGDLLVFSANMIHRGIYGKDRLALDVLFCEPDPELMAFVEEACLPAESVMQQLEDKRAFKNTRDAKKSLR